MQMYFLYQGRTESWKIDKYLWKNFWWLVFTSYNRDDEKCFKYLWQNFSWLERYQPQLFFFSQVPDVAKETKFIVSVNEFADEELEARKLGYLRCN